MSEVRRASGGEVGGRCVESDRVAVKVGCAGRPPCLIYTMQRVLLLYPSNKYCQQQLCWMMGGVWWWNRRVVKVLRPCGLLTVVGHGSNTAKATITL